MMKKKNEGRRSVNRMVKSIAWLPLFFRNCPTSSIEFQKKTRVERVFGEGQQIGTYREKSQEEPGWWLAETGIHCFPPSRTDLTREIDESLPSPVQLQLTRKVSQTCNFVASLSLLKTTQLNSLEIHSTDFQGSDTACSEAGKIFFGVRYDVDLSGYVVHWSTRMFVVCTQISTYTHTRSHTPSIPQQTNWCFLCSVSFMSSFLFLLLFLCVFFCMSKLNFGQNKE